MARGEDHSVNVGEGSRPRQQGGFAFDVIGIGALNVDYIVEVPTSGSRTQFESLADRIRRTVEQLGGELELEAEAFVNERTIAAVLEHANTLPLNPTLGGSAFTAIDVMARIQTGLRLGYVGIAGEIPVPGLSAISEMTALGIDHRYVLRDGRHPCGICFSFTQDGERTLLINPGANAFIDDYLSSEFDAIVAYLASAKIVHVTSFPGNEIASQLLRVLQALKEIGPATKVSFDPGHAWCKEHSQEVDALVQLSDFLILNYREFHELGRYADGDTDAEVAGRLVQHLNRGARVVLVKRPNGTLSFRDERGGLQSEIYPQSVLASREIRDATGAGDIFAAGLLTMLTCERLQVELGSMLGMHLARRKLSYVGSRGVNFAHTTRNFINSLEQRK